jgi:hypothetical protein
MSIELFWVRGLEAPLAAYLVYVSARIIYSIVIELIKLIRG